MVSYEYCCKLAKQHYENFPVASWFLPRKLRKPIWSIYAFARVADDIADEGYLTRQQRLDLLDRHRDKLLQICDGKDIDEPLFVALKDSIHTYKLAKQYFFDLLTAFRQDVVQSRYKKFDEVLQYCKYSANPVGRLLLQLFDQHDAENCHLADCICTGLQLINFWQDVHEDLLLRDRCYLPTQELAEYGVTAQDILKKGNADNYKRLMLLQLDRTAKIYKQGGTLVNRLSGTFGLEIRLIIVGGYTILRKLENRKDVFTRPKISYRDWPSMLFIIMNYYRKRTL